jgi:hypothetical protein
MSEELFQAWDELNMSIQRMLVSQPYQMSEAAERVTENRQKFDKLIRREAIVLPKKD